MKDKTYFLIFLFGCIILTIGIIITIILVLTEKKDKKDDKDDDQCNEDWCNYDGYVYSIFWPPSSCFNKYNSNKTCFERIDKLEINDTFIIHGLWPTYISGKYIDICNKGEEIDIDFDDINYKKILTRVWPGLYYTLDKTMWNHEYNKHGYCYIKRIGKDPEEEYKDYFDVAKGLLHKNYSELMKLILPDTEIGLHNVTKKKFKQFISESPLQLDSSYYSLMCNKNDSTKTNVFNEIRFYYGLDFKQINNIKSPENCPDNFQIYFSDKRKKAFYKRYDDYIFSLIWNPSRCSEKGKECYKKIKDKELNIFMIHGLWPSYKSGNYCQWCNIGEDIEIEDLPKDLKNNMSNYWVGTYTTNEDFWRIEYNKHGYCYNQRNEINISNYVPFFEKTLELYHKYNFKDLLKDLYPDVFAGIIELNKSYIIEQLNDKYGIGTFTMTCFKHNDKYLLDEIRFKFNMNLNMTTEGSTLDNCPEEIFAEFLEVEGPQKQAEGFYEVYDMYFFTILWLGTTCKIKGKQCYENIKVVPKNIFTMHGLWPNFRNGTLADWCNGKNDIEIEINDDPELLEFMNTHYVSGYHTNPYFWGHEYNKHGYCYNQRMELDVYDYKLYFNLAKNMYIKNNFANIFINAIGEDNIIHEYDNQINRTIIEKYLDDQGFSNDTYLIVCTNITENNETKPHILEIRIRYDLEFKLLPNKTDASEFDCPDIFYAQFL